MKKYFSILFFSTLLLSCKNTTNEKPDEKDEEMTLEELAKRHVESDLKIPSSEKYSMRIYKEHLNSDDFEDAIITVNRLDFAYSELENKKKTAKASEIGFAGNYNYLFYYDGEFKKITPNIVVMSSALSELKINFINLSSNAYKDIVMDFRLLNASFRDYITITNHNPKTVFEWNEYDKLGTKNVTANYFDIVESQPGMPKYINIYEGKLLNNTSELNRMEKFEPIIKKTSKLTSSWFFVPAQAKYCTVKK
ncbi:MAG: hypothetical protein HYR91_09515 [Flavobacteriia bacterium]|nr:hypothetical protein [Flavobacteriia bacterium]